MHKNQVACFIILIFFYLLPAQLHAQETVRSPKLPANVTVAELKGARQLMFMTFSPIQINAILQRSANGIYLYRADPKQVSIDTLLRLPQIIFIQPMRTATEEMVMNGSDLSLNNILYTHDKFPFATGKGLAVSIKEERPDSTDIDFKKRFIKTNTESTVLSAHATSMATLIGGAGNTYYTGKGVAQRANLSSTSFQVLLPEHDTIYKKFGISVQNHSYGTGIENFYGADSWAYDVSVNNNDSLLHVFSAGNSGTQTSTSGKYAGIPAVANITGSFKQSKNSLSVAASDSFYNVEVPSSRGPAYDGRIKPEITAFGQDGSSGAAALVSGTALLVQDTYKSSTGKLPSASLVRAALVNAADDIAQAGPDYRSGFGSLNTERSVRQIINNQYFSGSVANTTTQQYNITVPANTKTLKVTLAWNDLAAPANATKALINDLDLEVVETGSGNILYPFVLSSFPHIDSLNAMAVRKKDTLNNIEQVAIDVPVAGNYIIRVKGGAVQGIQSFSVVYNIEAANIFQFTYPTKNDNLYAGITNTIRWNSTVTATPATLQITYNGADWFTLGSPVNLTARYYKTIVKDTVSVARLRMSYGSTTILSDTFTISPRPQVSVGYSCADSFQLYWNKLKNVTTYEVYGLTDTIMRKLFQTADTSITIATNTIKHYAVVPLVGNKTGLRSYAFDHSTQGVGCFVNSFLADVFDDTTVHLKAVLGSHYGIASISFQRLYPLTNIATFIANKDTFTTNDILLNDGVYYYRVKLVFNNGKEVISDTLQVRIFQNKQFFVYPNPYKNGGTLIIQSKDHDNAFFELFNINGKKVFSRKLNASTETFQLPILQTGLYFYRIIQNNHRAGNGKLLVH